MVKVAGVFVVVILAGSACGTTKTKATELSDLRVCGAEAYSSGDSVCTRDEKAAPLTSRAIYCSARITGDSKGERFRGRSFYEGALIRVDSFKLPANANTVETQISGGDDPVPRGRWACELTVGTQTVRESFRSGAPRRPITTSIAACPSDATHLSGQMWVCKPGVGPTFPAADSVTCSAAFLHATGKTAHLNLVYKGRLISEDSLWLPHPLSVWGEQFFAAIFPTRANGKFPAGPYMCVFWVAGKEPAWRSFRLTG